MKNILIEETCDKFSIIVDERIFNFNHEDAVDGLIEVFDYLGFNAEYREVY